MKSWLLVFVGVVSASCVACTENYASSSTSATDSQVTTTTEPVEKSAVFDLSPIAGEWTGVLGADRDATARFPVQLELNAEGRRGSVVAEIQYTQLDGSTREGTLSALRADGNEYLFFQAMTNGTWAGQVRILHGVGADELAFKVTMEAFDGVLSGTLERRQ